MSTPDTEVSDTCMPTWEIRPAKLTKTINDLVNAAAVVSSSNVVDQGGSIQVVVSLSPVVYPERYSDADRECLYEKIRCSATKTGFFLVSDHGIENELIERAHDVAESFFYENKQSEKNELDQRVGFANGRLTMRGYDANESVSQYAERTTSEDPIDPVEKFSLGHSDNIWPRSGDRSAEFKLVLTEYYDRIQQLSDVMLRLFERALGVDAGTLSSALGDGTENGLLRLLHYPKQPEQREVMAGHTDAGTITIVSASRAGYEVLVDGEWKLIPQMSRNIFVVNLGDLFRIWTNDQWKSSVHRVRAVLPEHHRLSLAYFKNQDVEFRPNDIGSTIQVLDPFRQKKGTVDFGTGTDDFKKQICAVYKALRSETVEA